MFSNLDLPPLTDEVRVGDVPLLPGDTMTFLFDFGDRWRFDVLLERLDPENPEMTSPAVIQAHGGPPPQYPNWESDGW